MFVEGVSKLAAFVLLVCVLLVAITFGMVYSFNPDARFALQVTGVGCGAGILLVVGLVGLASFNAYVVRSTAAGAQAGTQKALETLTDSVTRSNDQTQATMAALLALTSNMTGAKPADATAQLQLPPKPSQTVGWNTPERAAEKPSDLIEVWITEGNGHKRVKHSLTLLNDFIRMSEPTRKNWRHGNDDYGATAKVIAGIDNAPLMPDGNGWRWELPHRDVIHWWRDLLEEAQ